MTRIEAFEILKDKPFYKSMIMALPASAMVFMTATLAGTESFDQEQFLELICSVRERNETWGEDTYVAMEAILCIISVMTRETT